MNDRQNLAEDTWGSGRMFQRDLTVVQEEHHGRVPWPVPNAEHLEFCMTFQRTLCNTYSECEAPG